MARNHRLIASYHFRSTLAIIPSLHNKCTCTEVKVDARGLYTAPPTLPTVHSPGGRDFRIQQSLWDFLKFMLFAVMARRFANEKELAAPRGLHDPNTSPMPRQRLAPQFLGQSIVMTSCLGLREPSSRKRILRRLSIDNHI